MTVPTCDPHIAQVFDGSVWAHTNEARNRVNGYGLLADKPVEEAPRMKKSVRATSAPREVRER